MTPLTGAWLLLRCTDVFFKVYLLVLKFREEGKARPTGLVGMVSAWLGA